MVNARVCEESPSLVNGAVIAAGLDELPRPTMRRNLSWTLAGNSTYTACQWGILVAMAKLGTPEMVGVFGLALAITAPIVMFADLELRSVQATDAKREYGFGHYLGLRLITSSMALLVIVGAGLIVCGFTDTALVVIAMGAAKVVESVSDVLYGLFQNRERMDRIAVSMVIKGVFALSALSTAVYLTGSAFWSVVALAVAWALVLLAYDIPSAARILRGEARADEQNRLRPRWSFPTLRRLAWISLPLGCAMMLVSLNMNIPRYFVQWHFGERQLGFFVAVAYLMVAGGMVVTALGQAACPRLARYHSGGDLRAFRLLLAKLAGGIIVLSGIGVLAALFAGREILTILYRPEYASGADVFVWLMVASGVGGVGVILRYGCISARRFAAQLPLWIVIAGSNALMCLLLIPRYGVKGAGMAMTVSAVVQVAGNFLILSRAVGRSGEWAPAGVSREP